MALHSSSRNATPWGTNGRCGSKPVRGPSTKFDREILEFHAWTYFHTSSMDSGTLLSAMPFGQNIFLIESMPGRHRLEKRAIRQVAWRLRSFLCKPRAAPRIEYAPAGTATKEAMQLARRSPTATQWRPVQRASSGVPQHFLRAVNYH